jgi:hypothetical protein
VGSLSVPRTRHTATILADGRVLIVGGRSDDERWGPDHLLAEVWDPATGLFRVAGSMPRPHPLHTATLLDDGRVLVVSGAQGLVWDPATEEFSADAWLVEPRLAHTAVALADGRVLIVGGVVPEPPGGPLTSVEVYQPPAR